MNVHPGYFWTTTIDEDNRAREVSTTANTSNIEIRPQTEAEKYLLREKLKKSQLK